MQRARRIHPPSVFGGPVLMSHRESLPDYRAARVRDDQAGVSSATASAWW